MTSTIVGPDIASYQAGLDLAHLSAAPFVIAKVTEGVTYVNPSYEGWRTQAAQLGKLFLWYHYLSGDPAAQQAAHTLAHVGDPSLAGMVDIEPTSSFSPTLTQALAYIDAARAVGLRVRLAYIPQWYWQSMGSPDLSAFTARGVHLVSSTYPGGAGTPSAIYSQDGGDGGSGWAPYGDVTPLLWQFTDKASDGGQLLDENAFRGTVAQLAADLGVHLPSPPSAVRVLQQELDAYGNYGLAVDGVKGALTDSALRTALSGAALAQGASGGKVRVLQAALNVSGATVSVDGAFGAATKAAVEQFQRGHGLAVDGVVGAHTVAALAA